MPSISFPPQFDPPDLVQALLVFGANMIIMNCGFGIGVTSPMISQLREEKLLDEDMASWFASSLVLGQIVGSIFGAWLANTVGRKKACIGSAFLSIFGWLIISASQYSWMLITGRVWTGFFDSLSYPTCIMFISEISEMKLRGSFLNSTALACGLGIAFGYLIGFNAFWRLACLAPIIHSALAIFLLWFCCESPVYLLMKREDASQSLRWYREVQQEEEKDRLEVEREMKELEEETSSTATSLKVSVGKLLAGENLRAYLVLGTLFMLYPLTGMYSITFFAVDLFSKLGLGDANTVAVITAFVRCLGTSLSSVLLYKFGRRKIMILSTALVTVIMGLIAGLVTSKDAGVEIDDTAVAWALTILIILFMFCVGLALVSFPWILMGEDKVES